MRTWTLIALFAALIAIAACTDAAEEASPTSTPSPAERSLTPAGSSAERSLTPTSTPVRDSPTPIPPAEGSSTVTPESASPSAGLEARLALSDQAPHVGAPLRMTLSLRNNSGQPLQLSFPTSQRYDFVVRHDGGQEVWRWSADKVFAQVLGEETLAPGEILTFEEVWDQRDNSGNQVALGRYLIEGIIVGCPPDTSCRLTASVTVNIAEP